MKIHMVQIRDVINRLRNKQSHRCIQRETGIDRSIVKRVHQLALANDWLDPSLAMPNDAEIAKRWAPRTNKPNHILNTYYDDFKEWRNQGHSAVVMHSLIKENCSCDIQTVRRYLKKYFPKPIEPVMVRSTTPGKDVDVDFGYLGKFIDKSGIEKKCWIFSARLRHSRKAYREVVTNQNTSIFVACHVRAFEYFNGVPLNVVVDNTKAAVIQSTIDNDKINRSYQDLAEHYGCVVTPCLPRTPQHKGGVEGDMKYVKRNFLPYFLERQKQRNVIQPTVPDLIEALRKWEKEVADIHIIHGVGRSPLEIFNTEEKKLLRPLPNSRWEPTVWSQSEVRREWRIMHENAYYSVPHYLIGKTVQVCSTSSSVRIFYEYNEVAFHEKATEKWAYKRKTEHAPALKEEVLQCTREGLLLQAEKIGPSTHQFACAILSHESVDKLRAVRSLLKLGNKYSQERLEKACQRACSYKMYLYRSVKNILESNLDEQPQDIPKANKVISMSDYRFVRDSKDYKTDGHCSKETFEDRLLREHPYSKYGHAMTNPWQSVLADMMAKEEESNE